MPEIVEHLERGLAGTERTIRRMHEIVARAKLDPTMQQIATMVRARAAGASHDGANRAVADAIHRFVQEYGLFQRDPLQIEKIESPLESMRPLIHASRAGAYKGKKIFVGDCDTFAIWVATLGGILGYQYAFETVKLDPNRPEEFSHVYTLLKVRNQWISYDPSNPHAAPGWRPSVSKAQLRVWHEPLIERSIGLGAVPTSNGVWKEKGQPIETASGFSPDEELPADEYERSTPLASHARPEWEPADPTKLSDQLPPEPIRGEIMPHRRELKPVISDPSSRIQVRHLPLIPYPSYRRSPRTRYSVGRATAPLSPWAEQVQFVQGPTLIYTTEDGKPCSPTPVQIETGITSAALSDGGLGQDTMQPVQQPQQTTQNIWSSILQAGQDLLQKLPELTQARIDTELARARARLAEAEGAVLARIRPSVNLYLIGGLIAGAGLFAWVLSSMLRKKA